MPESEIPVPHRVLAVIPARGGSKRIPRKNIRPFLGVPLLARTIGILRETALFDRIVISTDDDEVAAVALAAGAEVPFRRPRELSDDFTGTLPVIAHAISEMDALGSRHEIVCCAYPAAVLALPLDYQRAVELLRDSRANYVFSAASFPSPIQRALRLTRGGGVEMFFPEHCATRSQDLEPAFHDAGQFYIGLRDAWVEGRPLFATGSRMHVLPPDRVQDIDTFEDWSRAESLFRILRKIE